MLADARAARRQAAARHRRAAPALESRGPLTAACAGRAPEPDSRGLRLSPHARRITRTLRRAPQELTGRRMASSRHSPPVELAVDGHTVTITNPDRVYFSARGETKLDLA